MAILLLRKHEAILHGYESIAKVDFIGVEWKLFYINYQRVLFWYRLYGCQIHVSSTNSRSFLQFYWGCLRVQFHI